MIFTSCYQMEKDPIEILKLPDEFPVISCGTLFLSENILITGHENGLVVKWDLKDQEHTILFKCESLVETMAKSPSNEIAVGCNSGLLFTFNLSECEMDLILQPTYDKFSRVWKVAWVSDDVLIMASTYGVLSVFQRSSGWNNYRILGHSNSIFGLDVMNGHFIASGDWSGKILINQTFEDEYEEVKQLNIPSIIEGISGNKDRHFAAIDGLGHIHFFEKTNRPYEWKSIFETDTASSSGICIHLTEDSKTIFAGTKTELIQFDIDTQQVQRKQMNGIRSIFSNSNNIYILTETGLLQLERKNIDFPEFSIKYKYSKVSLIGHTGAGKTTLCSTVALGTAEKIQSTFGKRIWNWTLPDKTDNYEQRIMFHDHGGQETVLDTFLPFLVDSDIILIFFKKTDITTFDKALKIQKEIESSLNEKTKIFLIETFIDQPVDEINRDKLNELIGSKKIVSCIRVNPLTGDGIEQFKQELTNAIDWKNTRTMIRSNYVELIEKSIGALLATNAAVMKMDDFKKFYEANSGTSIGTNHLRFLLTNFSNQGSIEYYPDVADSIIFNDKKYNELRTNIPIEVERHNGIISIINMTDKFENHEYIKIIDQVYLTYGIAVENFELRIFPSKLSEKIEKIPSLYQNYFNNYKYLKKRKFRNQNPKFATLLKALSDLKLRCINCSTHEGIFAWEKNACIYFRFDMEGGLFQDEFVEFSFRIGGESELICKRLDDEFTALIERIYGPHLDEITGKKKDLKEIKFDVALSFASEQREYVEEVAKIIQEKGIRVFYDKVFQSKMWGEDLSEYLARVYYSQSNWCIMFISQDYITKMWPSHERKMALAKQVEVKGGYILPVRFDDSEVIGLDPSIRYEDARICSARQIAALFIEKYENT